MPTNKQVFDTSSFDAGFAVGKSEMLDHALIAACFAAVVVVLAVTHSIDTVRAEERAACQRKIEAMKIKPISPAPDLMMQKLRCVDRDLKTYGSPCVAWRIKT